MKLSKNVISGCHGYHFIELSRAILAFFVLLLGNNLRHGVDFWTFCNDGGCNGASTHHHC